MYVGDIVIDSQEMAIIKYYLESVVTLEDKDKVKENRKKLKGDNCK